MIVAIAGGSGLLGSNLIRLYSKQGHQVVSFSREPSRTHLKNLTEVKCDFSESSLVELSGRLKGIEADLLVNCIANVNLTDCEADFQRAIAVNSEIAERLASACFRTNTSYIHISTDHLFSDELASHTEQDKVICLNNYARSKYLAEQKVLLATENRALVVRTNIVGFRQRGQPTSFEWLLGKLSSAEQVTLFEDYITSPISVKRLGSILINCWEHQLKGVYNIAARDSVSKYDFGMMVAQVFGFPTVNIRKGSIDELNRCSGVTRGKNLALNVRKIERELGFHMPRVEETVLELYKEHKEINCGV